MKNIFLNTPVIAAESVEPEAYAAAPEGSDGRVRYASIYA